MGLFWLASVLGPSIFVCPFLIALVLYLLLLLLGWGLWSVWF